MKLAITCIVALIASLAGRAAIGGSATWRANPVTGDWNTAANWSPGGPPNGPADIATFRNSTVSGLSLSANIEVNTVVFTSGANHYTVSIAPDLTLTISGSGVINNSALTQDFATLANAKSEFGLIKFSNTSAGDKTVFTNNGSLVAGTFGGATVLQGSSSGGTATFKNTGGLAALANGGITAFFDNSTAGHGVFVNDAGAVSGGDGAATRFFDNSTAGGGTFINKGATISGSTGGGFTQFFDTSSAGNGNFLTEGGATAGVAGSSGGFTDFFDHSTADHGQFVVEAGTQLGGGGEINFFDNSTADNGTFILKGGANSNVQGGHIFFDQIATAGNGLFRLNGASGGSGFTDNGVAGFVIFFASSTAGHGSFNLFGGTGGGAEGGTITFFTNSSADHAVFANHGGFVAGGRGGAINFTDFATADTGTFINEGAGVMQVIDAATLTNGATINFSGNSSAANANFINNGGIVAGAGGGAITFLNSSTAGNGLFSTSGGLTTGAHGALVLFTDNSSAGDATLLVTGGLKGGGGGSVRFFGDSTGATARVAVFDTGNLDISGHAPEALTVGSIEGTGAVFLGANILSVGSNNLSTLFSGTIQDNGISGGLGGSLTKIGGGSLTLGGNNTYTGDTHIIGGVLQIDGSITSNIFIDSAGTLSGGGEVRANAVNSGIVSPGGSVGTLRIAGNYQQSTAGTLQLEVAGLNASQHDLLSIGGNAFLDGTLQLVRLNNFRPCPGDMITLLTAAGGVNGRFASVHSDFTGTIVDAELVYNPNDVLLRFLQGSFAGLSTLTINQKAVAANLDQVVRDPRAARLIDFLDTEPVANLAHDFDLIAPEELASIYAIGFSQATIQSINLERRLDDIRAGSNGFSAAGFNPRMPGRNPEADGKSTTELPRAFAPSADNSWGVFVTGAGEFVNVGNDDLNARGYDITTGGFTLGVDYRLSSNFAVGMNAGYARSEGDLTDNGHVTVDGGKVGFFATYFSKGFYLDGAIGGGWNSYDTRRSALLGSARGETDGGEFNGLIGAGYDWKCGGWTLGPTATFQYSKVAINSFSEEASLAPLNFPDQNEDSLRSTLGLKISRQCKVGPVIIKPELRAAWQHEFGDTVYPIDSRFASGAGNVFTVQGPRVGRDSALIGAGLGMQWNGRVSTYLYYDGQLGRSNYDAHNVSGGVRVSF